LDKIIERSETQAPVYAQPQPQQQYQQPGHNQQQYVKQHHDDHGYGQNNGHYKKKSWISELFD
jgi:Zn-finger nucleic acid-binding protein